MTTTKPSWDRGSFALLVCASSAFFGALALYRKADPVTVFLALFMIWQFMSGWVDRFAFLRNTPGEIADAAERRVLESPLARRLSTVACLCAIAAFVFWLIK